MLAYLCRLKMVKTIVLRWSQIQSPADCSASFPAQSLIEWQKRGRPQLGAPQIHVIDDALHAKGKDAGSEWADPEFMDPVVTTGPPRDVRLRPSSPAISKNGFKPIDVSQVGPRPAFAGHRKACTHTHKPT